jgi:hypothetical protein
MAFTITGVSVTAGDQDEDGYRNYHVTFKMVSNDTTGVDGPATAFDCPGLPAVYSLYDMTQFVGFGVDESDLYCWCHWDMTAKPLYNPTEKGIWYEVIQRYSSKPDKRCRQEPVEDPILEPPVISGNTSKYTEEATLDRFGNAITNSAWEQIRGPHNEWDHNRVSVKIKTNMATAWLGYILPMQLVDYVNSTPMWGLPPRTVKLSAAPWDLKFNGPCNPYYERTLEFDINPSGWDRDIIDEGTKALGGAGSGWTGTGGAWNALPVSGYSGSPNPNPQNPTHFTRVTDRNGNIFKVVLDGSGVPFEPEVVNSCDQCQDGENLPPKIWQCQGSDFNQIVYQGSSGCQWIGTSQSGGAIALNFIEADSIWQLTYVYVEGALYTWETPATDWLCNGPNTMYNTSNNTPQVTIYLQAAQAGSIHVEYYQQYDFIGTLNLPLSF